MRISIFSSARRELMTRMAQLAVIAVVLIMGPMVEDCRAPANLEEAWLIEQLYGPAQRWVIDVVPEQALETLSLEPGEQLIVEDVGGIRVAVLTSKTVDHLGIEYIGDRLRVYEIDT
jgi:hypothetical protein